MRQLFIYCLLLLIAGKSYGIIIEGSVIARQGLVNETVIQMFVDGRRIDVFKVDSDGKYKIELAYNHKYDLIFSLKGCFSQKILVETVLPGEVLQSNPKFPAFPLDISLFPEIPGVDKSFVKNPTRRISFNPENNLFTSEVYYCNIGLSKQIEQAVRESELIRSENEFLSKLTQNELAELKRELDKVLNRSNYIYDKELVLAALDNYNDYNHSFPRARVNAINDVLGSIIIAAELDKEQTEKFDYFIQEADELLSQEKYGAARISYNRALSIKPNDGYARSQSKLSGELLKKQAEDARYNSFIEQADNSFNEMLYFEAVKDYKEALQIKPGESYPKSKLEEIEEILDKEYAEASKRTDYSQAMKYGETMFLKQLYIKSNANFTNASVLNPADEKAPEKIEEVNQVMTVLADELMYNKLIASADRSFKNGEYRKAMREYFAAADIIHDDEYTYRRIIETNEKLVLEENFADLVFMANDHFKNENYGESRQGYSEALKIKPDDRFSKYRIREIDEILENRSNNEQYNLTLAQADKLFNSNDFENAKEKYIEAGVIKRKEKYPKEKIKEINQVMAQIAKTEHNYKLAVAKANSLYNQQSFEKAKSAFTEAGNIKPEENYPLEMIAKIDELVAALNNPALLIETEQNQFEPKTETLAATEDQFNSPVSDKTGLKSANNVLEVSEPVKGQETKNGSYLELIHLADQYFTERKFDQSRENYLKAQMLKSGENYPGNKIAEIDKIIHLQKIDEKYNAFVAAADEYLNNEKLLLAKQQYEKASKEKQSESYPKNQIAKIDDLLIKEQQQFLADRQSTDKTQQPAPETPPLNEEFEMAGVENELEINNLYDQYLTRAEELYDVKKYIDSRSWYYKAWDVKPDEKQPVKRIDEINQLLKTMPANPIDREYQKFIELADSTFRNNQYALARGWYNRALGVKSAETYPKEQLREIEIKIEERMAVQSEKQFDIAVQKASSAFEAKNYNVARFWYKKALELRPDRTDVKNMLVEIDRATR